MFIVLELPIEVFELQPTWKLMWTRLSHQEHVTLGSDAMRFSEEEEDELGSSWIVKTLLQF